MYDIYTDTKKRDEFLKLIRKSGMVNDSTKIVDFHRDNMRRKRGLKNKKANLQTYLRSMM